MYISTDTVRKYDTFGITDGISDRDVFDHIAMAEDQVVLYTGRSFNSRNLPESVAKATALIALMLIKEDTSISKDATTGNITSEKVEGIQITYDSSGSNGFGDEGMSMPKQAIQLLKPFKIKKSYCF